MTGGGEAVLFWVLGPLAVVGALGLVFARKAVHAALGMALIEKGWRVLFTRTTDLVQKLQIARRDLVLEAAIAETRQHCLQLTVLGSYPRASQVM